MSGVSVNRECRLKEAEPASRSPFPLFGSKFRYSGRTQYQSRNAALLGSGRGQGGRGQQAPPTIDRADASRQFTAPPGTTATEDPNSMYFALPYPICLYRHISIKQKLGIRNCLFGAVRFSFYFSLVLSHFLFLCFHSNSFPLKFPFTFFFLPFL